MKLAAPKGEGALTFDDLDGHVGGLVALAGRAVIDGPRYGIGGLVDRLVGVFGAKQVCVELQRHLLRDEEHDNHTLRDLAAAFRLPVIATNGVRFAEASDRPLYDVLTCIRHKTTLELAGRRLSWNAERSLKPPEEMARLFADLPEAIAGTRDLAERLEYTMADLGYRFPEYPVPHGETMASFLRKMTQAGARERYRPFHDRARAQIARELDLIETPRSRRLLPHRVGHRQLLPAAGHSRAGAGLGRQQRRVLQPGDYGGGSGRHGSAVRAVPVGRARRVARHRSRFAERRSARARDPAHLREIRKARRGHDGQRDHVSRPQRRARGGQDAVARGRADRSPREDHEPVRVGRSKGNDGSQPARCRPRRRGSCDPTLRGALGSRSRISQGTSASIPAAW